MREEGGGGRIPSPTPGEEEEPRKGPEGRRAGPTKERYGGRDPTAAPAGRGGGGKRPGAGAPRPAPGTGREPEEEEPPPPEAAAASHGSTT